MWLDGNAIVRGCDLRGLVDDGAGGPSQDESSGPLADGTERLRCPPPDPAGGRNTAHARGLAPSCDPIYAGCSAAAYLRRNAEYRRPAYAYVVGRRRWACASPLSRDTPPEGERPMSNARGYVLRSVKDRFFVLSHLLSLSQVAIQALRIRSRWSRSTGSPWRLYVLCARSIPNHARLSGPLAECIP